MKNSLLLFFFTVAWCSLSAQLTNNGATIVIEQGAKLTVEGSIANNTGRIDNFGTLEVQRDLSSNAVLNSTGPQSAIVFSGNLNSSYDPGGQPVRTLRMSKTSGNVNLTDDLTVTTEIDFGGSGSTRLVLNNADLFLGQNTDISGITSSRFISTNGNGFVEKALPTTGVVFMPIGGTSLKTLNMDIDGIFQAGANVRVRHRNGAAPDLPDDATDYLTYHNEIFAENISGYTNEVTSFYGTGSVQGDINNIEGASYASGQWSYTDAGRINNFFINAVVGTVTDADAVFSGTNFYGQVDPLVYLQGAYINGTNTMRSDLADGGLIPLASPYSNAPATAPSIPTGAVDWVKLELRNSAFPNTVMSRKSAFLMADGTIVGLDGTTLPSFKDAPKVASLAVYHRNHLAIRSANNFQLDEAPVVDLSTLASVYSNPSVTGNASMRSLGGGVFGLWSGDANGNGNVSYNGSGNDRTAILIQVGFGTPNNVVAGYRDADVNLNGSTNYNGSSNDRTSVLLNVGFGTPNKTIQRHID